MILERAVRSISKHLPRPAEAPAKGPRGNEKSFVEVEDVHLSFGDNHVLKGVDLEIRPGDIYALFGGSGGGKSVLLRVILGIHGPDEGQVRLFGTPIFGEGTASGKGTGENRERLKDDEMAPIRKRMSVVFQGGALYSGLTAADNIALELREVQGMDEDEIETRVKESLDAVGLSDLDPNEMTNDLSGGMKKRLAVARAIAPQPDLILYDEPTSALDPVNAVKVFETIRDLHDRLDVTEVIVSHDIEGACAVATRVGFLDEGRLAFDGTPEEFLKSEDPAIAEFRVTVPGPKRGGTGAPAPRTPPKGDAPRETRSREAPAEEKPRRRTTP